MKHKRWIGVGMVVLLALGATLTAGAQAKKADLQGRKLGLIFNIGPQVFAIGEAGDPVQAGLGLKYWLGEKAALRGLLAFNYLSDSVAGTSNTSFGLSGTFEYHFLTGKVSPYTGGLAGIRIDTGAANNFRFYLGGILGAEVAVMDNLGLYAEYNLLLSMDEPQFEIDLGIGNGAQIGVIVYLP